MASKKKNTPKPTIAEQESLHKAQLSKMMGHHSVGRIVGLLAEAYKDMTRDVRFDRDEDTVINVTQIAGALTALAFGLDHIDHSRSKSFTGKAPQ